MKRFNLRSARLFSSDTALIAAPLLLIIPNVCLCVTEHMSSWALCANILAPIGLYALTVSAFKRTYIGVALLIPIMVLCAFQIVLLFLYHGSIIAIDMFTNVATTNSAEAGELLQSLTGAMATVTALYMPLIIWCVYRTFRPQTAGARWTKTIRMAGAACLVLGAIASAGAYVTNPAYRISRQLFPVNVCYNMAEAINRINRTTHYHETASGFSYGAVSTHPQSQKEIYVMVIGETSRADNFGLLGYKRNTTPNLGKMNNLIAYRKALSESNTTHKSVPMLMSSLTAENFDSIYYRKSIITAFKEAGYRTAFFSAQKRNRSFIDFFGEEADETDFISDHIPAGNTNDTLLVQRARMFIDSNRDTGKLFIVMHTYGSHFRYDDRYADTEARFQPDNCSTASKEHRHELINAYDNTILNVDRTLCAIIRVLSEQSDACTAMIYASDHGEDIFDDDRNRFLHASPTPTYWQLHVPLLIWVSDSYAHAYPDKVHRAVMHTSFNVSSTRSLSPTIMDLAGLDSPMAQPGMALTSEQYTEPERLYLNDYNEATALCESGLASQDFTMIDRAGLSQSTIAQAIHSNKVFHFTQLKHTKTAY